MADKIEVVIDADLEDLIPGYLERLRQNVEKIRESLASGDLEQVRVLGHNMKGSGGGYGFDRISELGFALEMAARSGNVEEIRTEVESLARYLENLEIRYE